MPRVLEGWVELWVTVGNRLTSDVGVPTAIHGDSHGLVIGAAANQRGENCVALPVELDHKAVRAAAVLPLERVVADGKIDRGLFARQINGALVVERQGKGAIVRAAAEVGREDQVRAARIEPQNEC